MILFIKYIISHFKRDVHQVEYNPKWQYELNRFGLGLWSCISVVATIMFWPHTKQQAEDLFILIPNFVGLIICCFGNMTSALSAIHAKDAAEGVYNQRFQNPSYDGEKLGQQATRLVDV